MGGIIQIVGKEHAVQLFGIRLVGVSLDTGKKLLFSIVLLLLIWLLSRILQRLVAAFAGDHRGRLYFWSTQAVRLIIAGLLLTGLVSIWINNPSGLASAAAFITAGLAVALQRVVTAFAAYLIILRGKNFNVGDRIVMGGVRGDVIALGFMQTTIMEMGEPPSEQGDAPSMWVAGRQYTGRIVTITNDKVFDNPVYNYTRDFPYIWEEMRIPIPYDGDRRQAEKIIVDAAIRHTVKIQELSEEALKELERRYAIERGDLKPRVFIRLTDNWVEMAVRFVTEEHGIRSVKDRMSRDIMDAFDQAHISIASGTYQVVGMPELKVRMEANPSPAA